MKYMDQTLALNVGSANYNKLIRIARVARLYRLLRIVRLFKIFKIFRYSKVVQRFLDLIKLNAALGRMIMILVIGFFSVHLVSCIWYLFAKMRDFDPDTWVYRMGLQDAEPLILYLECVYWALQTVATVGFGEFGANTIPELVMSILWMLYGCGFYSIIIGNLTSMIANQTAYSENLFVTLFLIHWFIEQIEGVGGICRADRTPRRPA